MAIALPAPATPQLGSVETIRAAGSEYATATFQQTQVHVSGPDVVPKSALEEVIAGGESLSDVVRQIQAAYYAAGYPAVQVSYALAEPDLYVLVSLGKVDRIDAPAPYDKYFAGIAPADPLTDEALEPARTLASLHADRAGERAMPTFKTSDQGVVLSIEPDEQGPDKGALGVEYGNPGNRFVGRHFLDYSLRASLASGDEFKGSGRHALTGMEGDDSAAGYHEHSLGWSKVTTLGLFGITGRYVNYQQNLPLQTGGARTVFDGDIRQAEAEFLHLLSADFDSRWTVGAKLDYTRKDFATNRSNVVVQRQEYGSGEISTDYATVFSPVGLHTDFAAGVAVRSGLGNNKTDEALVLADLGYLMYRPNISMTLQLGTKLNFSLGASGQITSDTLPEQQQWVLGGIGNGEAYLPGVAAGDSGGIARAQFEFNAGQVSGLTLVPRVFAEYAYTRYEDPIMVLDQPDGDQSFADAGVSLGLSYADFVEISVSYAESFAEDGIDKGVLKDADANVFFKVGIQL